MRSTTTGKTIEKLGEMFSRFGSPAQLISDNGPQLVSQEMSSFLQDNRVELPLLLFILQRMALLKGLYRLLKRH